MLGLLLNRKSDLSIRNGVVLYKQLLHPMVDYVYSAWRFDNRTNVQKAQVLHPIVFALPRCPLVH